MDGGRERRRLLEIHPAALSLEVAWRSPGGHLVVTLEQRRDKGTRAEISEFPEVTAPWEWTADLAETGSGDGVRGQQTGSGVNRRGQGQSVL